MSDHSSVGHERTDVRVGPLAGFLVLLALGCAAALALMAWLFGVFNAQAQARDLPGHPLAPEHELPSGPQLQPDPPGAMRAFAAEQQRALQTPAWLDRDAGVVRLPVERALELVLDEGLPVREGGSPPR